MASFNAPFTNLLLNCGSNVVEELSFECTRRRSTEPSSSSSFSAVEESCSPNPKRRKKVDR
ncbi:hypothetical protein COLO4_12418 [Corchorus olitorius]|uniref:Uncharacterized protein n=1 Tax=Corchorus olitorius TaxID=93759 RepID=A0A1R3K172_9ROSI|nr:hypothetical protein COLO4_12418 [Corchorus olitorius]